MSPRDRAATSADDAAVSAGAKGLPPEELARTLARAQAGQRAALGRLFDAYGGMVYRFLHRQCGDAQLAEDLCGEVFLRLVDALRGGQDWDRSFTGWLFRVARNLLIDHRRKASTQREVGLDAAHSRSGGPDPVRQALQSQQIDRVRTLIERLTDRNAQILLLRFGEGMSHREVADHLGMSEGAVKVAQHRALKQLREWMEPDVEEAGT